MEKAQTVNEACLLQTNAAPGKSKKKTKQNRHYLAECSPFESQRIN